MFYIIYHDKNDDEVTGTFGRSQIINGPEAIRI